MRLGEFSLLDLFVSCSGRLQACCLAVHVTYWLPCIQSCMLTKLTYILLCHGCSNFSAWHSSAVFPIGLQVFAQPVFENMETFMTKNQIWPSKQPRLMRAVVRSLYVVVTTFVAICVPFFADLMGLIGAAGFTPMTFILPCVFWLKVNSTDTACLVRRGTTCMILSLNFRYAETWNPGYILGCTSCWHVLNAAQSALAHGD